MDAERLRGSLGPGLLCALIAEEDLGAGVVALGGSLALLQRDLLKLLWAKEMARKETAAL